eukprot:TRINITY_DN1124_c0_g2_i1.p1 TRINITY_DN1124_c0_g2~~TRINITY_DN1124_c0_g2_i1.p1  ORF type:complete len:406 (-),score=121.46 TRINITY_DN1124_c0_g2_i1:101-1318(-)
MLNGGFCSHETVSALWEQKNRMDSLFEDGKGALYYSTRDTIFPEDKKGSSKFRNRAGDKMMEVHQKTPLYDVLGGGYKDFRFLDVCGGPGAFSQALLEYGPSLCQGFGITLKDEDNETWWYRTLEHNNNRFKVVTGKDRTGNVYNPSNLKAVATTIAKSGPGSKSASGSASRFGVREAHRSEPDSVKDEVKGKVQLVVSDGGFKVSKDKNGQHVENLQELYSARIILSEILVGIETLESGGSFLCKLFDCFSVFTASLIYSVALLFQNTYIVKPLRSRIVNSERYLVGSKMISRESQTFVQVKHNLAQIHQKWWNEDGLFEKHPKCALADQALLHTDTLFFESYKEMIAQIAAKQTSGLSIVMNKVEEKLASGDYSLPEKVNSYHKSNDRRRGGKGKGGSRSRNY